MKRFISQVILFLCPFAVLFSLSFLSNPDSGDLARMAGLRNTFYLHQQDFGDVHVEILNGQKDSSVVIIGDSFLNRSESSRNVQHHVTNSFKILPFCTRLLDESNPFKLLEFVSDSVSKIGGSPPRLVILECVERAAADRIESLSQTANVKNISVKSVKNWTPKTAIKKGMILALSKFWRSVGSHKTGSGKVYQLRVREKYQGQGLPPWVPVYAYDALYRESTKLQREEFQAHFNTLSEKVASLFPQAEVKFLIIPDKSSVLAPFYELPSQNEPINWEDLHSNILYPIEPLQTAIEKGISDVYRWGDTHLGNNGSRIVGDYIQSRSETLTEEGSKMMNPAL